MEEPEVAVDVIEVSGTFYKVWKKEDQGIRLYSFDSKTTWHPTALDAYRQSASTGSLVAASSDGSDISEDEFQVFVVAMIHEIAALKPGESLKIIKDSDRTYVMREEIAIACSSEAMVGASLLIKEDN